MGDLADNPPDDLRKQNKQLAKEVDRLQRELRVATTLRSFHTLIPAWTSPKRKPRRHTAAPVLLISDTHFGEYVDYRAMDGWNAYDDDIAMSRWQRVINEVPGMLERHAAGYEFPFMVVALMGDMLSGDIHDELAQTNVFTTPETVTTWVPRIVAGLQALADSTGIERIVVPCVDGNHDRNGKHKTAKRRAESSWTWVIYQWIADRLKDDPRFHFIISRSSAVSVPVFDERFLFIHGDGARGGGGIGGIWPPIMRYVHKLSGQWSSMGEPVTHVCMGHWHQATFGRAGGVDWTVNGSLKGLDEWARSMSFNPEPAQQVLMLVAPGSGTIGRFTVFGDDPHA